MNTQGIFAWLLVIGLVAAFIFFACGDDDDDDNDDNDSEEDDDVVDDDDTGDDDDDVADDDNDVADDDDDTGPETWTDPATGTMWQVGADGFFNRDEADDYCENLSLGGYDDWHLPTIGELRTLVTGCPKSETGGACRVADDCTNLTCVDGECSGCGTSEDPYWPPDLQGLSNFYWSSTQVSDFIANSWIIDFRNANILNYAGTGSGYARCAR